MERNVKATTSIGTDSSSVIEGNSDISKYALLKFQVDTIQMIENRNHWASKYTRGVEDSVAHSIRVP